MTERVRANPSWYASDTAGTLTNPARLLPRGSLAGTGTLVILPVDQGVGHGPARSFAPTPPAYDPRSHFELAIDAGCNAYATIRRKSFQRPKPEAMRVLRTVMELYAGTLK